MAKINPFKKHERIYLLYSKSYLFFLATNTADADTTANTATPIIAKFSPVSGLPILEVVPESLLEADTVPDPETLEELEDVDRFEETMDEDSELEELGIPYE